MERNSHIAAPFRAALNSFADIDRLAGVKPEDFGAPATAAEINAAALRTREYLRNRELSGRMFERRGLPAGPYEAIR